MWAIEKSKSIRRWWARGRLGGACLSVFGRTQKNIHLYLRGAHVVSREESLLSLFLGGLRHHLPKEHRGKRQKKGEQQRARNTPISERPAAKHFLNTGSWTLSPFVWEQLFCILVNKRLIVTIKCISPFLVFFLPRRKMLGSGLSTPGVGSSEEAWGGRGCGAMQHAEVGKFLRVRSVQTKFHDDGIETMVI